MGGYGADARQEVDGALKRPREQTRATLPISLSIPQHSARQSSTHPVKNIFPTLAPWKLKTLLGLALFTISRFSRFRKLRISSFLGDETTLHSSCRASTISSHSRRAACGSDARRWLKKVLIADLSGSLWLLPSEGIKRTRRPAKAGLVDAFKDIRSPRSLHHLLLTSPIPEKSR